MEGEQWADIVYAEDKVYAGAEIPPVLWFKFVSPGVFEALGTPLVAGRDFTWADLYRPVAVALGFDLDGIPEAWPPEHHQDWRTRFESIRASRNLQRFLSVFPTKLTSAISRALSVWTDPRPSSAWLPRT